MGLKAVRGCARKIENVRVQRHAQPTFLPELILSENAKELTIVLLLIIGHQMALALITIAKTQMD